jgi:hypothetical protein
MWENILRWLHLRSTTGRRRGIGVRRGNPLALLVPGAAGADVVVRSNIPEDLSSYLLGQMDMWLTSSERVKAWNRTNANDETKCMLMAAVSRKDPSKFRYDAYQAEVAVSQQNKSREEGRKFQAWIVAIGYGWLRLEDG